MVEMTPSPRDTSLVGDLKKFDRRALIWLWSYLQLRYESRLYHPMFDVSGEFQKQVNEAIEKVPVPNLPRNLATLYNQIALDKSHFQWIKSSNERLLHWLALQMNDAWPIRNISEDSRHRNLVDQTLPPQISLREKIIARFDLWDADLESKKQQLTQLNNDLGAVRSEVSKLLSWLEKNNDSQHEWVFEYIRRKDLARAISGIPELSNSYDTILSWFECSKEHPAQRELFLRTMGQRWSQAKYKKKLRGKQRNFILTKETNDQLDKLKKTWGVSRSEVVQRLIKAEIKAEKAKLSGPSRPEPTTATAPAEDTPQQESEER